MMSLECFNEALYLKSLSLLGFQFGVKESGTTHQQEGPPRKKCKISKNGTTHQQEIPPRKKRKISHETKTFISRDTEHLLYTLECLILKMERLSVYVPAIIERFVNSYSSETHDLLSVACGTGSEATGVYQEDFLNSLSAFCLLVNTFNFTIRLCDTSNPNDYASYVSYQLWKFLKYSFKALAAFSMLTCSYGLPDLFYKTAVSQAKMLAAVLIVGREFRVAFIFFNHLSSLLRYLEDNALIKVFLNCLLGHPKTSEVVSAMLLRHISNYETMKIIGKECSSQVNILLSLIDDVLQSLVFFPSHSSVHQKFLGNIIKHSIELIPSAAHPSNYFSILQSVFKVLSEGRMNKKLLHLKNTYKRLYDTLPALLNAFDCWLETPVRCGTGRKLLETHLVIVHALMPDFTAFLLPHCKTIVEVLLSLNESNALSVLSQLQECVDCGFINSQIWPLKKDLLHSLYSALQSPYSEINEEAFTVLGKFRGHNRDIFKQPMKLKEEMASPCSLLIKFKKDRGSINLPLSKIIVDFAYRDILNHSVSVFRKLEWWSLVQRFLKQYVECHKELVLHSSASSPLSVVNKYLFHTTNLDCVSSEVISFADQPIEACFEVYKTAFAAMFVAAQTPELFGQVKRFLYEALKAVIGNLISDYVQDENHHLVIFIDAAVETVCLPKPSEHQVCIDVLVCIVDTAICLKKSEEVWDSALLRYMIKQIAGLCYQKHWEAKLSGCRAIKYLLSKTSDDWKIAHIQEFLKPLFYCLNDSYKNITFNVVDESRSLLKDIFLHIEKIVDEITGNKPDKMFRDVNNILIEELKFSPHFFVRDLIRKCICDLYQIFQRDMKKMDFPCELLNNVDFVMLLHEDFDFCSKLKTPLLNSGIQMEHSDQRGVTHANIRKLIAVRRLHVRSTPNNSDIMGSNFFNEFFSQHNMERQFVFVDQRSIHPRKKFYEEVKSFCSPYFVYDADTILYQSEIPRKICAALYVLCFNFVSRETIVELFQIYRSSLVSSLPEVSEAASNCLKHLWKHHRDVTEKMVNNWCCSFLLFLKQKIPFNRHKLTELLTFLQVVENSINWKRSDLCLECHLLEHFIGWKNTVIKQWHNKASSNATDMEIGGLLLECLNMVLGKDENVLEEIIIIVVELQKHLMFPLPSSLKDPLLKICKKFPSKSVFILLTKLEKNAVGYYSFLKELFKNEKAFLDEMIQPDKMKCLKIHHVIELLSCALKYHTELLNDKQLAEYLLKLWNSENLLLSFSYSKTKPLGKGLKVLVKSLLHCFTYMPEDFRILFDLMKVFKSNFFHISQFLKDFIDVAFSTYSIHWKAACFGEFHSLLRRKDGHPALIEIFQFIILPLFRSVFKKGCGRQLFITKPQVNADVHSLSVLELFWDCLDFLSQHTLKIKPVFMRLIILIVENAGCLKRTESFFNELMVKVKKYANVIMCEYYRCLLLLMIECQEKKNGIKILKALFSDLVSCCPIEEKHVVEQAFYFCASKLSPKEFFWCIKGFFEQKQTEENTKKNIFKENIFSLIVTHYKSFFPVHRALVKYILRSALGEPAFQRFQQSKCSNTQRSVGLVNVIIKWSVINLKTQSCSDQSGFIVSAEEANLMLNFLFAVSCTPHSPSNPLQKSLSVKCFYMLNTIFKDHQRVILPLEKLIFKKWVQTHLKVLARNPGQFINYYNMFSLMTPHVSSMPDSSIKSFLDHVLHSFNHLLQCNVKIILDMCDFLSAVLKKFPPEAHPGFHPLYQRLYQFCIANVETCFHFQAEARVIGAVGIHFPSFLAELKKSLPFFENLCYMIILFLEEKKHYRYLGLDVAIDIMKNLFSGIHGEHKHSPIFLFESPESLKNKSIEEITSETPASQYTYYFFFDLLPKAITLLNNSEIMLKIIDFVKFVTFEKCRNFYKEKNYTKKMFQHVFVLFKTICERVDLSVQFTPIRVELFEILMKLRASVEYKRLWKKYGSGLVEVYQVWWNEKPKKFILLDVHTFRTLFFTANVFYAPENSRKFFQIISHELQHDVYAGVMHIFEMKINDSQFYIQHCLDLLSEMVQKTSLCHDHLGSEEDKETNRAFLAVMDICRQDKLLAEHIWMQIFPAIWNILEKSEQQKILNSEFLELLSRRICSRTSNMFPNADDVFVTAAMKCDPAFCVFINDLHIYRSFYLLTLSSTSEKHLALQRSFSPQHDFYYRTLNESYTALEENDLHSAFMQNLFPTIIKPMTEFQEGNIQKAHCYYKELIQMSFSDSSSSRVEVFMYINELSRCSRELAKWNFLSTSETETLQLPSIVKMFRGSSGVANKAFESLANCSYSSERLPPEKITSAVTEIINAWKCLPQVFLSSSHYSVLELIQQVQELKEIAMLQDHVHSGKSSPKDIVNKIETLYSQWQESPYLMSDNSEVAAEIFLARYVSLRDLCEKFSLVLAKSSAVQFHGLKDVMQVTAHRSYDSLISLSSVALKFQDIYLKNISMKNYSENSAFKNFELKFLTLLSKARMSSHLSVKENYELCEKAEALKKIYSIQLINHTQKGILNAYYWEIMNELKAEVDSKSYLYPKNNRIWEIKNVEYEKQLEKESEDYEKQLEKQSEDFGKQLEKQSENYERFGNYCFSESQKTEDVKTLKKIKQKMIISKRKMICCLLEACKYGNTLIVVKQIPKILYMLETQDPVFAEALLDNYDIVPSKHWLLFLPFLTSGIYHSLTKEGLSEENKRKISPEVKKFPRMDESKGKSKLVNDEETDAKKKPLPSDVLTKILQEVGKTYPQEVFFAIQPLRGIKNINITKEKGIMHSKYLKIMASLKSLHPSLISKLEEILLNFNRLRPPVNHSKLKQIIEKAYFFVYSKCTKSSNNTEDNSVCSTEDNSVCSAEDNPVCSAEDNSVCSAEDNSVCSAEDNPVCSAEDNPVCSAEDNPVCSAEDNSVCSAEDNSVCSAEDNSICSAEDNSICSTEDNSICSTEDNSICSTEDNSINTENNSINTENNSISSTENNSISSTEDNSINNTEDNSININNTEDNSINFNNTEDNSINFNNTEDNSININNTGGKSISSTEDNSVSSTEDNSININNTGGNSISSTEDNSVSSTEDKSISSTEDKSISSTEDKSISSTEDNSIPSTEDNSVCSTEELMHYLEKENILKTRFANNEQLDECLKDILCFPDCLQSLKLCTPEIILNQLKKIRFVLSKVNMEHQRPFMLNEKFPFFSNFDPFKEEIDIFGQSPFLGYKSHVKLNKILPNVEILKWNGVLVYKLSILGDNGKVYPFIINENFSTEESLMNMRCIQALENLGLVFEDNARISECFFNFFFPRVTSVSPDLMLMPLQYNLLPYEDIYQMKSSMFGDIFPADVLFTVFSKNQGIISKSTNKEDIMLQSLKAVKAEVPDDIFIRWVKNLYPSSFEYYAFRKQFMKQLSLLFAIEYFFNMHVSKHLLISRDSGLVTAAHLQLNSKNIFPTSYLLPPNVSKFIEPYGIEKIIENVLHFLPCLKENNVLHFLPGLKENKRAIPLYLQLLRRKEFSKEEEDKAEGIIKEIVEKINRTDRVSVQRLLDSSTISYHPLFVDSFSDMKL